MTWQEQLKALRYGPYLAHGGVIALAHDLGVHIQTLRVWLAGRNATNYKHQQTISKLWEERCRE